VAEDVAAAGGEPGQQRGGGAIQIEQRGQLLVLLLLGSALSDWGEPGLASL